MNYSTALSELVEALLDGDKIHGRTLHDLMDEILPDDLIPTINASADDLVAWRDAYWKREKERLTTHIENHYPDWIYERIDDYHADQRAEHAEAIADARRMMEEAI